MNKPIEENLKLIDTKYESPEEEIYKIEKTLFNLEENLEQTEENIKKQLFQLSLKNIVPDISELRLANLSEQIYRLELTQFSESITRIQLNKKTNDYLIHFDKTENIEQEVHITAEFPNATDKNEILEAFDNVINLAAQYAQRN